MTSSNSIAPPSQLEQQGYPDMTGLVRRSSGLFPLHNGGFSDIYIGTLIENPSLEVAIKVLRTSDELDKIETIRRWLNREAIVWHGLRHKNILSFLGLASDLGRFTNCPALISPYCRKGTSGDYVRLRNSTIKTRVLLIMGIARGLEYLHGEGVVHGDIKPSNVLMGDNNEPLLCDFGRSTILDLRGFTTRPAGAARYQAVELVKGEVTPNKSTDVCAFGLTAFELWTGIHPYAEIPNNDLLKTHIIMGNARTRLPDPPPVMVESLWPILSPCLSVIPKDRPSIQTVAQQLESCI